MNASPEPIDVTESERSSPPTSVLLPTVRWTAACSEVAAQLGESDELLVICDTDDDPVAERREESAGVAAERRDGETGAEGEGDGLPDGVRVVLAGEPEGCSGKANAIAAGMAAATHDRIVWTDDDFARPPDWLATLHADYDRQGPTTELPAFVGRDPLGVLLEPAYVVGGTIPVFLAGIPWGGAVVFERDDLDEAAFLADLRRTVSDDGTLGDHLDVTPVRRTRVVPAGGSIRASLERYVRFVWIVRHHAPRAVAVDVALAVGLAALCLLVPLPTLAGVTLVSAATYAWAGLRRPSFLLAGPAVLATPPLLAYAFARRTFVWGGRRYRWAEKHDVRVHPD